MPRYGDQTRTQLRWQLAHQIDDHLNSTATSAGTTTTLVDSQRVEPSGAHTFAGRFLYFPDLGWPEVVITAYTFGTGFTFTPAFATATPSGAVYEVHARRKSVYDRALRQAELGGRHRTWLDVKDESLTWRGDTYRYTLSGITMDSVAQVRHQYDTNNWYRFTGPQAGPRPQWRIEHGQAPMLVFDRSIVQLGASGGAIQLIGQRRPLLMAADTDTCEILDADWVIDMALVELHTAAARANDSGGHLARADRALARAERDLMYMNPPMPGSVPLR